MTAIDWTKICKKYKGLWVGLKDDEKTVIAWGKTVKEAMDKAQKKDLSRQRSDFFGSSILKPIIPIKIRQT